MSFKNQDKTLLILDLDETLVYATEEALDYAPDFEVFGYSVYQRPFLLDFLHQVQPHFLLAAWSSASDDYVEAIVSQIFSEDFHLEFVWGRSRCSYKRNIQVDEYGYFNGDYFNHYHYTKPLKKLKRQGFDLNRILIVDDTPHKAKDNYGNVIYPKMFEGDQSDDELKYLGKYLLGLKDDKNVRRIEKRNWRNWV